MKTGWKERQNELIHITDSDGNVYNNIDLGTGDGEENSFVAKFEISKSIVNSKKIFLNMTVNGEKHMVELISK